MLYGLFPTGDCFRSDSESDRSQMAYIKWGSGLSLVLSEGRDTSIHSHHISSACGLYPLLALYL